MESQINRLVIIGILCAGLMLGCVGKNAYSTQENMIRVALLTDIPEFDLSIRGRYEVIDFSRKTVIDTGKKLDRVTVTTTDSGVVIGKQRYPTAHLRISVKNDATIYHKGKNKRYRGNIDILREGDRKLLVINVIDLETYVRGVLYHEVPHYWPMNAMKTQAVATRTYVLYQAQNRQKQKYDVTSDIYSQVYGGRSAERYRSNIAVNRTRGEVLTYRGKILPAYFHSACGGKTENVSELWKEDLAPLKGVVCGFCRKSPHSHWKKNFRSKDIQELLNTKGMKLGLIKEITVTERTASGRAKTLTITGRDGKKENINAKKFRDIIGPNTLKSSFYDIVMARYYFDIVGKGWGHGVGMCQWGAYEMSRERYKYTSILEHYYPGAKLSKLSD